VSQSMAASASSGVANSTQQAAAWGLDSRSSDELGTSMPCSAKKREMSASVDGDGLGMVYQPRRRAFFNHNLASIASKRSH
jgi:hypothetical protein